MASSTTRSKGSSRKKRSRRGTVAPRRKRSRVVKGVAAPRRDRPSVRRVLGNGSLSGWAELSQLANERKKTVPAAPAARWSTRNVLAVVIVVAAVVTSYVGHVHATRSLATAVHEAKMEQEILRLHYDDVKGRFDYATQPSVIYERAAALGLTETARYGEPIEVPR